MKTISDVVYKITYWIGSGLLCSIFIMIMLQIFCRYVLGHALVWPEETCIFLFAWMVLIGASMALKDREHVGINFVVDLLPLKLRNLVKLLTGFAAAFFAAFLMVYGLKIAIFVGSTQATTFWNIPYFYLYLSVCVSGLLLFIQAIFLIVEDIRKIFTERN